MKILSIRIKNLASLAGEHFIDFESEPLASAGLVAIVGKTGAGKSTILDAMCLTLYNEIPRFKGIIGSISDVSGQDLTLKDPKNILRRGCADGFAELEFIGNDQKRYLAQWKVWRAHKKVDGVLKYDRSISNVDEQRILTTKSNDCTPLIEKLIGLSFDQFTRAVLLAQSEVTALLKAPDSKRSELLEYLTNSSIFGKIGQLAFERTKAVTIKRKEIENLLGHVEVLTDEEVAKLNSQFQIVDQNYKNLEAEKSQLEKQQQWFEYQQKLDTDIMTKQQLVNAQQQRQQDLVPERLHLNRLEIFSEIRSSVLQQQQLLKIEQNLAPKIQQQQHLFTDLKTQFDTQKTAFIQTETALNELQSFENIHRESLNEVRKCIQEREFIGIDFKKTQNKLKELEDHQQPLFDQKKSLELQIQQITQQQSLVNQSLAETQQFTSLDHGLNAHLQQLDQFIQQYQNIENQLGNFAQAEQQLSSQKKQLNQFIEQHGTAEQLELQIEQVRQQREQKIQQRNQLDLIQQKLAHFFELKTESQRLNDQIQTASTLFQQSETDVLQAEQDFQSAKTERQNLQDILQHQRLLHAENIENLRADLQNGEPCLVCGSTLHPYKVDDAAVSKALFKLQQQQEQQAIVKEQEKFKIWQNSQQVFTKYKTELEQLNSSIQSNADKVAVAQNALLEQVHAIQIKLDLTQPQAEISTEIKQLFEQYQADIQQIEMQSNQWIQSIKTQQRLNQNIQHAESLLDKATQLQHQVQHIVSALSDAEKHTWQQHSTATAQQIFNQLSLRLKNLEHAEQLLKDFDQFNQQLHASTFNIEHISKQVMDTKQALDEIKAKGLQNTETATQLILHMTGLTDIKPNEWLIQHDQKRLQTQSQYQQLKQNFEQLRVQFEQEKGQLDQLNAQLKQNQNNANMVNVEIQNWLIAHPDFKVIDLTELSHISPAQEQQIRQQLQNADRLFNEVSAALKTIQEQLTEHQLYQPKIDFNQLQQLISENVESIKSQNETLDHLKVKIAKYKSSLEDQKRFNNQIQEIQQEEYRWGKISGLMGDATGKKFRDYAQQYNLDILLEHANQQLAMLSQRYTLKRLADSLSLAIIDHDMDGETRSVASLSGGESFLTALALSLAIANMASGSMKIESLFIDEGFGTLDASSLHMVMNALDQLQNQGRKVVLISHIQEMHERIPVQIQVRPLGAGASSIEIVS